MSVAQELSPDIVPVNDLDTFVQILAAWHADKCSTIQHLLAIPEGAEFRIGEGDEEQKITLNGDALHAFKLGVEMAMMQLGTLPFVAEMEDEPEATPVVPS